MITIQESIYINSTKEDVWNFTQNFDYRRLWDESILACEVLEKEPVKLIWLKLKGGIQTKLRYKLCDKPHKTSLKMYDTKSLLLKGGGGSWKYIDEKGRTKWTQINSIELKSGIVFFLLGWFIKELLKKNTKTAMKKAKSLIEEKNNFDYA